MQSTLSSILERRDMHHSAKHLSIVKKLALKSTSFQAEPSSRPRERDGAEEISATPNPSNCQLSYNSRLILLPFGVILHALRILRVAAASLAE
eukprot:scaffold6717_cov160-Amphora_coffeaeformis.AAC.7